MVRTYRSFSKIGALLAVISLTVIGSNAIAQKQKQGLTAPSAAAASDPVLIKTSKQDVTLSEFEQAYRRMNDKNPYATTLDSLKDFLVIYADYRLKLLDAKAQKLESDPKITKEMDGYRALLAGPFVLDKMLTDPAIQKMFERRQVEVEAAHFLARVKDWNNPADTLRAYKRALKALEKLRNGDPMSQVVLSDKHIKFANSPADFKREETERMTKHLPEDSNAWEGSDDPGSAQDNGSLGWFTGGQTIRPFEDAAYGLRVMDFTQVPIKTRFGYHVVQLLRKQPRISGVKVHHILVAMSQYVQGNDTLKYYHKIDSAYKAILAGAKFEDVAKSISDDKTSADKGGDMGYIDHESRRAERPFDEVAYNGLKDGQMSGIVRTSRGYHIIRRDGIIPNKTFAQDKDQLKKLYKNFYFNEDKDKVLTQVKKDANARIDSSSVNIFFSRVDSSRTTVDSLWAKKFTVGEKALTIYEIEGKKTTIGIFIDSLNAQPGSALARNSVYDFINKHLDDAALQIIAKDIDKKYPEFENMMADYKNGIMLFELENRRVWNNVKPDSVAEVKFYTEHKARFMWPERIDVSEIYVMSDSLAKALYKRIINGENFDTLAKQYTERPGYKQKAGRWGLMTKSENEMSTKAFNVAADNVSQPMDFQSGFSIVKVNRRVPITQKTYEEAKQEVASQYQDELSNDLRLKWVQELRKQYKLQINMPVIEKSYSEHAATQTMGQK
jgi:peptidyl-prolyl cis-trans isomerase SurA